MPDQLENWAERLHCKTLACVCVPVLVIAAAVGTAVTIALSGEVQESPCDADFMKYAKDGDHSRRAADCRTEVRPAVQVVRGHRDAGHGLHAAHPGLHEGHGTAVATPLEQERSDCGRGDDQGEALLVLAFLSQDRVHGLRKRHHTGAAVAVEGGDIEWVNDIRERRGKLGDYEQYFNTLFEHFVGGSKAGITLKQLL